MRLPLLLFIAGVLPVAAQIRLNIQAPDATNRWVRFQTTTNANSWVRLEATTNFSTWQSIGASFDNFWNFPDPAGDGGRERFYRLRVDPRVATNDWKNELVLPDDPLRSPPANELSWVKFTIPLGNPTQVFYQDSAKFPFHFDFAASRLPGFAGMSPDTFNAISLYRTNQQVILGTILAPTDKSFLEYGVQFVGRDPYTPEEIGRWFELVKATVFATNGAMPLYMPVFEQAEVARTNAAAFEALGIPVANIEQWVTVDHVYSSGWGLGQLKFFRAGEIAAAYADGRLRAQDILLTDGVPAETPLVAGIISLTPSTPNSHTAILSQSFEIPFIYLPDAADRLRAQALVGRKVLLRARSSGDFGVVKILDVEGLLSPAYESELLALKKPAPIAYPPREDVGAISASTENLGPADIKYFGGKAANYGVLRDTVPSNSPPAIAFSFRLWDQFLDQTLPGGQTLRAQIGARLAPYTNYPADIPSLKIHLTAIRDLIRQTASFNATQKQAILSALGVFDSSRKIRFRSSTNLEDGETFTGAGLYDSFSGCLQDDLDGDNAGPSQCDPSEPNERGVFRAMQRVYASFYNDNAFLERLRHRVDETKVGMGLLVHHSFPDEEELANGVATLTFGFGGNSTNVSGTMVTQLGANSVSNPDGSSIPEVVNASRYSFGAFFSFRRQSSLVALGGHVLAWEAEYRGMLDLLTAVGSGFRAVYPTRTSFYLDFEYKKDSRLGLAVKQVRQIPGPVVSGNAPAYLVDEPTTYCVAEAEFGNAFSNHRLKSIWTLHTDGFRLTPTNLTRGIYTTGSVEYLQGTTLMSISGPHGSWPEAAVSGNGSSNIWMTGSGTNRRTWALVTAIRTNAFASELPIFTQQDFLKNVSVTYARPMPAVTAFGAPTTTTNETIVLEPCPVLKPGAILREYTFTNQNGLRIETRFYWPNDHQFVAGYTAPLVQFIETRITGLTSTPIVLRNYYSQTYHPFHHNFVEEFIFEPRLEPGLPAGTLAELAAANVQLIYARRGSGTPLQILGLDNSFRTP